MLSWTLALSMIGAQSLATDEPGTCHITPEESQMTALGAWSAMPVVTIGESLGGYSPPGILDGVGAMATKSGVRLLVNHEINSNQGYAYSLANGTSLTGARISFFDIDPETLAVCDAGLAFHTIYNRAGLVVEDPTDLEFGALHRLCSSGFVKAGEFGLVDDIYFAGEESAGGTEFALDVANHELWAAPALGRAAWENIALLDGGDPDRVALLVGDDRVGASLRLYLGTKQAGAFLERNGLASGALYVWVADNGDQSPEDWNGTGTSRIGQFVEIDYFRPDLAGNGDYDDLGYATQSHQDALAAAAGAFRFSRPEDLSTSPGDGTVTTFASTGRAQAFPSDSWGTVYRVDVDFSDLSTDIRILYDADDAGGGALAHPDDGLRNPDNLDWGDDDRIYVNEDPAFGGFGNTSGEEASLWSLSPTFPSGGLERIGRIHREAALPDDQTDANPGNFGAWESSGVLDVSELFGIEPSTLLVTTVQAHTVINGSIGGGSNLVQGGQLLFLMGRSGWLFNDGFESGDTTAWSASGRP